MEVSETHIVIAERMDNGVIVTFDDGKSVFYRCALLRSIIPDAEDITGLANPDLENSPDT